MTITIGGTNTGKVSARQLVSGYLTTATQETPTAQRVRGLLDELDEIARDREMAARFAEPGTWPNDLDREERDVWEHIVEALSSANTKEEQ